jgi:DNA-binding NtrC family response regulator
MDIFLHELLWEEDSIPADTLPTLRKFQQAYIDYLLEATRHNLSKTARILNISRGALYGRIERARPERIP